MPRIPGQEPEEEKIPAVEETIVEELEVTEAERAETEAYPEAAAAGPESHEERYKEDSEEEFTGIGALILKGILRLFYDFLNPLLVPTYATLLVFELSILSITLPHGAALSYTLTVFGISCILPLLTFLFLRRIGAISSITLETRRDRIVPYIIEFLAMAAVTVFFVFKGAPFWLWLIYCGGATTIFINMLLNFRWRVSCHCSAIAAVLATLIVINSDGIPHPTLAWWAIGTALLAGFLGTGAMLLGRHRLRDVLIGYATGFLPIILLTLIR